MTLANREASLKTSLLERELGQFEPELVHDLGFLAPLGQVSQTVLLLWEDTHDTPFISTATSSERVDVRTDRHRG